MEVPGGFSEPRGLGKIKKPDLIRAVRHHRRAIDALQGANFSGLAPATGESLRGRLQLELRDLQAELERRRDLAE